MHNLGLCAVLIMNNIVFLSDLQTLMNVIWKTLLFVIKIAAILLGATSAYVKVAIDSTPLT